MLDVHSAEHAIGSVREFLLHPFTITCGLLIALALENAAEALHHRHQRREAEESIRRELEGNRQGAKAAAPQIFAERKALENLVLFVHARCSG